MFLVSDQLLLKSQPWSSLVVLAHNHFHFHTRQPIYWPGTANKNDDWRCMSLPSKIRNYLKLIYETKVIVQVDYIKDVTPWNTVFSLDVIAAMLVYS